MTIMTKVKDKLTGKSKATPKRPTFKPPETAMAPDDTLPSESEPTPEPKKAKGKKEKPEMPDRFKNGGATADERAAWVKENWGDDAGD